MYTERVAAHRAGQHELLLRRAGEDPCRGRSERARPDVAAASRRPAAVIVRSLGSPCSWSLASLVRRRSRRRRRSRYWLQPRPADAAGGGAARRSPTRRRRHAAAAAALARRRGRAARGTAGRRPGPAGARACSCSTRGRAADAVAPLAARRHRERTALGRPRPRWPAPQPTSAWAPSPTAADAYRDWSPAAPAEPAAAARRCCAAPRSSTLLGRCDEARSPLLERVLDAVPGSEPQALLQLGDGPGAAAATSAAAAARLRPARPRLPRLARGREAARARCSTLAALAAARDAAGAARRARPARRRSKLFEAGRYTDAAAAASARLLAQPRPPAERRRRARRASAARCSRRQARREARRQLRAVPRDVARRRPRPRTSSRAADAPRRASARRLRGRRRRASPARRGPRRRCSTLAHFYQKDARDDEALPYFRAAAATSYPAGPLRRPRHLARRLGRLPRAGATQAAAELLREGRAHARRDRPYTAGFLVLGGRARRERWARRTARGRSSRRPCARYKHAYHGLRAREALGSACAAARLAAPAPRRRPADRCPSRRARACASCCSSSGSTRRCDELRRAARQRRRCRPRAPGSLAAGPAAARHHRHEARLSRVDRREAATALPDAVWRILYPARASQDAAARRTRAATGLDPALVAARHLAGVDVRPGRGERARARAG